MPYDAAMVDELRDLLSNEVGIGEKKMFGGLTFTLNGNMLCGVMGDRFMMRVGADSAPEALKLPGTEPVAFGGRKPMSGFIWVEHAHATGEQLREWLDLAIDFVCTLPAK